MSRDQPRLMAALEMANAAVAKVSMTPCAVIFLIQVLDPNVISPLETDDTTRSEWDLTLSKNYVKKVIN